MASNSNAHITISPTRAPNPNTTTPNAPRRPPPTSSGRSLADGASGVFRITSRSTSVGLSRAHSSAYWERTEP
jgi:hypothetical protein